jgi:S-DNA-T family DNA segregation ATPase FtsK/SpoIIIE
MTEPLLIQRQRAVLRDLARLATERVTAEAAADASFTTNSAAAQKEYQEATARSQERFAAECAAAEKELQATRQTATSRFQTEHTAAGKEYAERRSELNRRYELEKERADQEYQETSWSVTTLAEAKKKEAEGPRQEAETKIAAGLVRVQALRQEGVAALKAFRHYGKYAEAELTPVSRRPANESLVEMKKRLTDAEEHLATLKALRLPRFFAGLRLLVPLVAFWVLLAAPLYLLYPDGLVAGKVHWLIVSSVGAVLLGLVFGGLFYALGRLHVHRAWDALAQALTDAEVAAYRARELATKQYEAQLARLHSTDQDRDANLKKVEEKYQALLAAIQERRDNGLKKAEEKYPALQEALVKRRDAELAQAEEKHRRGLAEAKQRYRHDTHQAEEKQRRLLDDAKKRCEQDKQAALARWQQGMSQVQANTAVVVKESRRLFPDWSDASWQAWKPPLVTPPAIRFGEYQVQPPANSAGAGWWQGGAPPAFSLPALVPFPERASLLLRARDNGRGIAVQALQALMARFLTALPAGKCRFTIIDPVGLGENFATYMHLADHDEQLVGSRIWTEPRQIEERLADIAAHMENVIQKYLRNQYRTIEEYNAQAGEVAEPFRVLVVANFPANFNSDSARRLVSIANSGPSCGVYTLVSVDTKQPMPDSFDLADLEQSAAVLSWDGNRFGWKDPDFGPCPLQLDPPPSGDFLTRLLGVVGAAAKQASRVEVSFDFIAPPLEQIWTASTKSGVDVPLGRAGATKRQHLRLGHGTAQHVLIAGKTGSGKSTLLHALITNLALYFSPDEIELYLVDFKKGVEFKTYANHELPHARVIAIESEREFGLSVLQRLDQELRKRGERFRTVGAHDIAGYRQATNTALPRIMLIVDEFQEFFTEDDKIAQEAALLLDRLVRQGRAFGLHVLLGSQTLGGAYTLARSTIDQMAVRIALQCSEADAHLILSKDNSAARLLSRPGEAIYNDQNGLVEGNDIFQVVWLPDDRREEHLKRVRQLAKQRKMTLTPPPPIVFEGNAPADVAKNPLLTQVLRSATWPAAPRTTQAWLGEAIAIKDPTAAVFRRHTGSNLIMIGQHEDAALGILATALVGLAAQHAPEKGTQLISAAETGSAAGQVLAAEMSCVPLSGARFYVLDGTPADAARAGYLAKLGENLPHSIRTGGYRELPALMTEIAEELDRRQKQHDADWPSIYLMINGLHRFRELRKADDDFGFARKGDEPANPAKQLADILKEGAGLGIHALIWVDGLNNLQRSLDRQALREFEMRVLFQMSVNDSSTLIDSPAASKLGMHRALFHSEDKALPEKFRPYGLPAETWLQAVKQVMARKRPAVAKSAPV